MTGLWLDIIQGALPDIVMMLLSVMMMLLFSVMNLHLLVPFRMNEALATRLFRTPLNRSQKMNSWKWSGTHTHTLNKYNTAKSNLLGVKKSHRLCGYVKYTAFKFVLIFKNVLYEIN